MVFCSNATKEAVSAHILQVYGDDGIDQIPAALEIHPQKAVTEPGQMPCRGSAAILHEDWNHLTQKAATKGR